MDEPTPPPTGSQPEQDLPRPPIWEQRQNDARLNQPPPDITIPDTAAGTKPGPAFESRAFLRPETAGPRPSSGETTPGARPQWPSTPPTATAPTATAPTAASVTSRSILTSPHAPPTPPAPRRRMGLVLVSLLALIGLAAGAFFVGRSVGGDETADVPVAAPVLEEPATPAPTVIPPTPVPATPVPPTAVPEPESATPNDSSIPVPAPVVPDDAPEPVAAVAQAVAPAVVLIQHEQGQGSGIIYDEAGLILTNAHVVGPFVDVSVQLASGIRVPGTVLGADTNTDVAVIQISTDAEFGVAPLAPESTVEVGQLAVAIGSPFGLEQTVTSGIVSAKGRVVGTVAMIQTDAPINPGNSGGALADRQGRVIGMNTSIRTDGSGGNIGVGFAIPSDTMLLVAERIIAGDSLEQGYLGVTGATPLLGQPGVVVQEVLPDTGAAIAGVLPDDLIVGFNGIEIRSMGDLAAAVRLQAPNATVTVDLVRGGTPISVQVTLGVLPS